jgi:hypothetical protein
LGVYDCLAYRDKSLSVSLCRLRRFSKHVSKYDFRALPERRQTQFDLHPKHQRSAALMQPEAMALLKIRQAGSIDRYAFLLAQSGWGMEWTSHFAATKREHRKSQ